MRRLFCILIALSMLSTTRTYAASEMAQSDPKETLGTMLLIAAVATTIAIIPVTATYLALHREDLSKTRGGKFGLMEAGVTVVEGGKASLHGHSLAAGILLSREEFLFGRYSQIINQTNDINFKSYELGFRYYLKVFYAEAGIFDANHQRAKDFVIPNSSGRTRYRFDAFETLGGFGSLGMAGQFSSISCGLRATAYRGLSTRVTRSYTNSFNPDSRFKEEARDDYSLKYTLYFDLGLSF